MATLIETIMKLYKSAVRLFTRRPVEPAVSAMVVTADQLRGGMFIETNDGRVCQIDRITEGSVQATAYVYMRGQWMTTHQRQFYAFSRIQYVFVQ